jgi:hypothetical protein
LFPGEKRAEIGAIVSRQCAANASCVPLAGIWPRGYEQLTRLALLQAALAYPGPLGQLRNLHIEQYESLQEKHFRADNLLVHRDKTSPTVTYD